MSILRISKPQKWTKFKSIEPKTKFTASYKKIVLFVVNNKWQISPWIIAPIISKILWPLLLILIWDFIYIYIHTNIHTYKHIYIHTYIQWERDRQREAKGEREGDRDHSKTHVYSFRERENGPKANKICKLFLFEYLFILSYFCTFTYCVWAHSS